MIQFLAQCQCKTDLFDSILSLQLSVDIKSVLCMCVIFIYSSRRQQSNSENQTRPLILHPHLYSAHSPSLYFLCVVVYVCRCVLPGVSPANHSHPHSRPVHDHAAAAHSNRDLLQPLSCGTEESAPYCLYSQVMHPSPTESSGKRIRLEGGTMLKLLYEVPSLCCIYQCNVAMWRSKKPVHKDYYLYIQCVQ